MRTSLSKRLTEILNEIPDPRQGLPIAVFEFLLKLTPMVNVDLLIKNEDRTLLTWRQDRFGKGWHVPGGIIRLGEPAAQRIAAVADQELGATVDAEESPCNVLEYVGRRGHFISLLYRCRLTSDFRDPSMLYTGSKPMHGVIAWIAGVPDRLYPSHENYQRWLAA